MQNNNNNRTPIGKTPSPKGAASFKHPIFRSKKTLKIQDEYAKHLAILRKAQEEINQLQIPSFLEWLSSTRKEQIHEENRLKATFDNAQRAASAGRQTGRQYRPSLEKDRKTSGKIMALLHRGMQGELTDEEATELRCMLPGLKNDYPPSDTSRMNLVSPENVALQVERVLAAHDARREDSGTEDDTEEKPDFQRMASLFQGNTSAPTTCKPIGFIPRISDDELVKIMTEEMQETQCAQSSVPQAADHEGRWNMPGAIQPDTPDPAWDFADVEDPPSDHEDEMVHLGALYEEHCPPSDSEDDGDLPLLPIEFQ